MEKILPVFTAIIKGLVVLWPLWILLALILVVQLLFEVIIPNWIEGWKKKKRFEEGVAWRSDRDVLRWLRGMKPNEFEGYIATLFEKLGYVAEAVGRSHDGGIDVIATKNGITHYIQCKKFITSTVPVGAVRDFYGALADRVANGKGYFITTNKFTLEAEKFAEDKPIELIDGQTLVRYIHMAEKNNENFSERPVS